MTPDPYPIAHKIELSGKWSWTIEAINLCSDDNFSFEPSFEDILLWNITLH